MFDKKTCSMNRAKIVECDHAGQRAATPRLMRWTAFVYVQNTCVAMRFMRGRQLTP